jgi:thiol:disulfide interchange protein
VFLLAGVLLSLTPCVLPMLPILSSIIVGQGARVSRWRGFSLAASYSLGMAMVYTALGVAAGLAGAGLAAALQTPWVLALFGLGLVALALSMFGVYELQLPAAFSGRMTNASQRLPAGRYMPVFAKGGISALIVSPCVAAPLAGALVYLSQTRDVVLGGSALFSLAAGMSVPLLLVGASAGALLPRAGAWYERGQASLRVAAARGRVVHGAVDPAGAVDARAVGRVADQRRRAGHLANPWPSARRLVAQPVAALRCGGAGGARHPAARRRALWR